MYTLVQTSPYMGTPINVLDKAALEHPLICIDREKKIRWLFIQIYVLIEL